MKKTKEINRLANELASELETIKDEKEFIEFIFLNIKRKIQ